MALCSAMAAALWRAKVIVGYEATRPDEVTLKVISFVYVNAYGRFMWSDRHTAQTFPDAHMPHESA